MKQFDLEKRLCRLEKRFLRFYQYAYAPMVRRAKLKVKYIDNLKKAERLMKDKGLKRILQVATRVNHGSVPVILSRKKYGRLHALLKRS